MIQPPKARALQVKLDIAHKDQNKTRLQVSENDFFSFESHQLCGAFRIILLTLSLEYISASVVFPMAIFCMLPLSVSSQSHGGLYLAGIYLSHSTICSTMLLGP